MTKEEERQAREQLANTYPQLTFTADRIKLDVTEHDSGALIVKPAGEPSVYNYATTIIPPQQR